MVFEFYSAKIETNVLATLIGAEKMKKDTNPQNNFLGSKF